MMAAHEFTIVERRGAVSMITLNRPHVQNAWHLAMREEFEQALREAGADPQVKSILITGAGDRAFSAGQDLSETQKFEGGSQGHDWTQTWRKLYTTIRALDKPLVAALNGVAAGSAFQVALMTDVRVGHSGTRMGQPEINSAIPSVMGPWLMIDRIGLSRATELTLSGRMMDAKECHEIGLIHHMTSADNVKPLALKIAAELGEKPEGAMRENKRHFRTITEEGFQNALRLLAPMQERAFASGEPQLWMKKFFEQRAKAKQS
jgi:enoyl-CoA hydratase/carnithine racemase